jgi:hypothetical protein
MWKIFPKEICEQTEILMLGTWKSTSNHYRLVYSQKAYVWCAVGSIGAPSLFNDDGEDVAVNAELICANAYRLPYPQFTVIWGWCGKLVVLTRWGHCPPSSLWHGNALRVMPMTHCLQVWGCFMDARVVGFDISRLLLMGIYKRTKYTVIDFKIFKRWKPGFAWRFATSLRTFFMGWLLPQWIAAQHCK